MLVVMEAAATAEQIADVVGHIERVGLKALPIPGAHRTAIAVTGNQALKDPLVVAAYPEYRDYARTTKRMVPYVY